jgi:hypothetical protein
MLKYHVCYVKDYKYIQLNFLMCILCIDYKIIINNQVKYILSTKSKLLSINIH